MDMEQSGLPLLILKSTTLHKLIARDPRDAMKKVYKRSITFPWAPAEPTGIPGWAFAMYEITLVFFIFINRQIFQVPQWYRYCGY